MLRWKLSGMAAIVATMAATAQNGYSEQRPTPEAMRRDVELLRGVIHQAHPDPYRYRTRIELDRIFDRVSASCSR
jgi:hypothetical protein